MKYFKDSINEIFAYALDGSQDAFIKPGLTEITEAEKDELLKPTAEQQAIIDKTTADKARYDAMLLGAEYSGKMISLTKDDGDGMLQVKAGFEFGLTSTNISFKNGTILPMTVVEFPSFALWFVTERNRFFA